MKKSVLVILALFGIFAGYYSVQLEGFPQRKLASNQNASQLNLIFEHGDLNIPEACKISETKSFSEYFLKCLQKPVEEYFAIDKSFKSAWVSSEQVSDVTNPPISDLKFIDRNEIGKYIVPAFPTMSSKEYSISKRLLLREASINSYKVGDLDFKNSVIENICNQVNYGSRKLWCSRPAEIHIYLISDIYFNSKLGRYFRGFWIKGYSTAVFYPERSRYIRNLEMPVLWALGKSSRFENFEANVLTGEFSTGGDVESNTYEVDNERFLFFTELLPGDQDHLERSKEELKKVHYERSCPDKSSSDERSCLYLKI